jgi:hypothetical protein
MTYLNEYIPEADYTKYDLRRICGERNLVHRGHMYSRSWTVDRDRDSFLIKVWSHRDSDFSGWAFYWTGEWNFFEMRPVEGKSDPVSGSCMFRFHVRRLKVAPHLRERYEVLLEDLREAITAVPGGVEVCYAKRDVTVEFADE